MTVTGTRRTAAKVSAEMAELIDAVVTNSPHIASESALIRHGVNLALKDALDRNLVEDPALKERIGAWLIASSIQIGEPLGRS